MVNLVPSSATRSSPARRTASAVTSARCSSGIPTAASMASATLCMVLVHSTRHSAPAASTARASSARSAPAAAQSPADCIASTSAKSTDDSTSRAEWKPPRRSRTSSLSSW